MSLQGQVEEMGLGAVIQTLSLNRYMGTLRIETEDAGNQFLFLSEGEIVLVRQVQRDPVRLGDLLLRAGKLQQPQLESALSEQKKRASGRLGALLVELGMIQQDEIERVIRAKFEEDVLDMFLLDRGRFEFIFGLSPEALFAPDEKLERVALNAEGLMLEAMRRIDEWQEMFKSLGNLDTIYQRRGSQSEAVAEAELPGVDLPGPVRVSLYGLLDGTRSLREVLAEAIRSRIASRRETFLFLYGLNRTEMVTPLDSRTLLTEARNALGARDVPKAAKYIRAILGRKGELELSLTRRYLEFLRKNKRPKLAFEEARLFAAQCLARGEIEPAIALYEEAASLEFRNAEVLDRLFYTLLRANHRERAVQVGLALRDHLGSEAGLTVATRVVRNLKELAPDHPEVHELAGLVHRQREENEDAIRELEKALGTIGQAHARRPAIVSALLELQPGRPDLVAEKESAEMRSAREQLRREFRRRLLLVGVFPTTALLLSIAGWLGWREKDAHDTLARARALYQEGPGENLANYRQASELLGFVLDSWTASGDARALREELDQGIAQALKRERAEREELIQARREAEAEHAQEEARRRREAELEEGLRAYTQLVERAEYAAATAKALELGAAHAGARQLQELKAYLRAESEPPGAEVYLDDRPLGQAPQVIGIPLGRKAQLRLRLRGYQALEQELEGGPYQVRRFALQAGPVWRYELSGPPLLPMGTGRLGVVLAEPGGQVTPLSFVDGHPLWSPPSRDALAEIQTAGHERPQALEWAVAVGSWAVAGAGPILASWELSTGHLQRVVKLPGRTRFFPPAVVRLRGQEVLVLLDQRSLTLYAPGTGEILLEVLLPAPAVQAAGVGGGMAFVPLQGDVLVAVDLQERAGSAPIQWRQGGIPAVAPPLWSERSEAVVVRGAQELRSIRAVDGQPLALLRPELGQLRDAVVIDERIYVLGEGGSMAGLGIYDGELVVRSEKVAEHITHGPVLLGKDLALVDAAGAVYRVSPSGRRHPGLVELGGTPAALQNAQDRMLAVLGQRTVVLLEPAEE